MQKSLKDLKVYSSSDFPSYLPKLNALYDDLFSGGKGFRSKLIQMVSRHLDLKDDAVHLLGQTIEFIHNASLLHDDLVDRSHLRRNKTTAWLKYTPEYAVLAGDYLLARVMVNLSGYGNVQLIQYTAEMISDLLEGEWIQDSLVGEWNVTLEQLDQVHNLKTASSATPSPTSHPSVFKSIKSTCSANLSQSSNSPPTTTNRISTSLNPP